MLLNHAQIKRLLPHRYPMALVDAVMSVEPGVRIVAIKNVTGNEPCFATLPDDADWPAYAYPGSLMMESFGQASGLLFLLGMQQQIELDGTVMLFGAATRCRFEGEAFPGDTLEHRARLERTFTDAAIFRGEVWVSDRRIVTIERMVMALRSAKGLRPPAMGSIPSP